MNRYEYSKGLVYCDLCEVAEAGKWKMCDVCRGAYVVYYNYTVTEKIYRKTPMTPEEYVTYKKWEKAKIVEINGAIRGR